MSAMDRFELYELCVQSPASVAAFLRAVHQGRALALREDFCGRAAIAREWLALDPRATALAVDSDPAAHGTGSEPRLERRVEDVTQPSDAGRLFDVVHAGNFSLGYWHTRAELLRYLKLTRGRLADGGIFVADTFGGASAQRIGTTERAHYLPDGRRVRSLWRRLKADPSTGLMHNTLSFCVDRDGEVEWQLSDAFEYHWRLWSLPELRDACRESGFETLQMYEQLDAAQPSTVAGPELGADYTVCIVARTQRHD
jgi:hypothetical protein